MLIRDIYPEIQFLSVSKSKFVYIFLFIYYLLSHIALYSLFAY
jgi:hypothetical protein